jgi:hypothetical protein
MAYTTAFQYEDCRIAQAWALKSPRRRPVYSVWSITDEIFEAASE